MVKQATKTAQRPAGKGTATPQRGQTAAPGGTRAQQAARHQGRNEQPAPPRRDTQPETDRHHGPPSGTNVPARRGDTGSKSTMAEFGTMSNVPAFMRGDAGMGKENIGREDLETPRLKLIQGLSPELQDYNDLRAGHFFHSASETIFDTPFRAVPIYMDRRYILWRPRDDGGGILARADDGVHWSPSQGQFKVKLDKKDGGDEVLWTMAKTVQMSGLANWGTMNPKDPNSPPAATLMYSFVLVFPDEPDLMPAVLTFQRSSIKMGRRFNTKLKTVRTPLFGCVFEFSSFTDSNSRGQDFYNVNVKGAGIVEDEALYDMYKQMHLSFKDAGLSIKDIEGLQGEDAGDNESDEPDSQKQAHQRF